VEEAGHEQGGPCRPTNGARLTVAQNWRARATCIVRALSGEQRGGERLMGGPRQQCRAAVPLTSGARRAAGEGERSGALISETGLSARVEGGEAVACTGRAWAHVSRPGKEKVGQAQMNNRISDLFKSVLNKFKMI
jgi:hypothetical protein